MSAKPATSDKGEGVGFMLMMPPETLKSLRKAAAEQGTTVRALALEAFRRAGYDVPMTELRDRRRK